MPNDSVVLGDAMRTTGSFDDDSGDSSGDDNDEDETKPLKISRTKKRQKKGSVSPSSQRDKEKEDRASRASILDTRRACCGSFRASPGRAK